MYSNIRPIYEFYILVYVYRCISIYIPVYTYQKYSSVRNVWVSILLKSFLGPLYLDAWDAKIFTKKTKSPLFSQRKAAVGWRSWWCGNFLLLTEVYSEVQVGATQIKLPDLHIYCTYRKGVHICSINCAVCKGLLMKGKSGSGLVELVN